MYSQYEAMKIKGLSYRAHKMGRREERRKRGREQGRKRCFYY